MHKIWLIFLNAVPILLMIGLIPLVANDYLLALLDVIIIIGALAIKQEKYELLIFAFGFLVMILFEYLFVSTGVEVFGRHTLFGLMPIWLPLLWGYGFIGIKRGIEIIKI
jgi:hypothetical protein